MCPIYDEFTEYEDFLLKSNEFDALLASEIWSLRGQIGHYPHKGHQTNLEFTKNLLSLEGLNALYGNVHEYQKKHIALAEKYQVNLSQNQTVTPAFFRENLLKFIAENASKTENYTGSTAIRETSPEAAAISLEDLLGEEGVKLYQLALEEEANSPEYLHAVFRQSVKQYTGRKWAERPVVIVGGPSASGKSFAADAAVKKASEFLPKEPQGEGNDVVFVDGGVAREVSQIRKLAIQLAIRKGYTGISDLHSESAVLEAVKKNIQKAAFATTTLGVVIPETFSDFPFGKRDLLDEINSLPKTKPIFSRVEGADSSIFQQVVAFLGSRRAWKTDGFDKDVTLDLNISKDDIPESKAYGRLGFYFGKIGSVLAELWFRIISKDKFSLVITNDLILKKPDRDNPGQFLDAAKEDKGAFVISKSVFDGWKAEQEISKITLKEYSRNHPAEPLIQTSSEIKSAAHLEAKQLKLILRKKTLIGKDKSSDEALTVKIQAVEEVLNKLKNLDQRNKDQVDDLALEIDNLVIKVEEHKGFGPSITGNLLKKVADDLKELSNQLQIEQSATHIANNEKDRPSHHFFLDFRKTLLKMKREFQAEKQQNPDEEQGKSNSDDLNLNL